MTSKTNNAAARRLRVSSKLVVAGLLAVAASVNIARAADQPLPVPTPAPILPGTDPIVDYFLHWFDRKNEALATQPHWMTPLATVTPRLEEEFRYDQYFEQLGNGGQLTNYDNGKGLELIPTTTNEVLINLPAYEQRQIKKPAEGTADWGALTVKQRLLSANEENGNYILTAFLGFTAPTGSTVFTNDAWIITPTIAGGWGIGDFDVQGTVGANLPVTNEAVIGRSIVTNIAFQYHLFQYFWPEIELNDTAWTDGTQRGGKNQLFLTPGIIFGRFPLGPPGVNLNVGAGYQFAVAPSTITTEPVLTPMYDHAVLFTARVTF